MTKSIEKPSKSSQSNMASTLEKCRKMTQLMLENERPEQRSSIFSTLNLRKEAENAVFNNQENECFSNVLSNSKHSKERKGPEYRRIKKYIKSTKQYWEERNRRKKAWELLGKGHSYKQIAKLLGVSERTIIRDINRIRPYYLRQTKAYFRKLEAERRRQLQEKLAGATLHQQHEILMAEWKRVERILDFENKYLRHQIFVNIDLDDVTNGFPSIRFWPKHTYNSYVMPITININCIKDGKKQRVGAFTLSYKRKRSW